VLVPCPGKLDKMNRVTFVMGVSIATVFVLLLLLIRNDQPRTSADGTTSDEPIMLYCAASNRAVMESVRADFEKELGQQLQIQYGPSQTLLTSLQVSRTGDLFLPADDSYIDMAQEKELIEEVIPLARMEAVIAVKKGNPKQIRSYADLLREDVRLVQASPDAAAVGKITRDVLSESGQWQSLETATLAFRTTVTDVANDLVVGAADAGIVYDAVLHTYPQLEAVRITELEPAVSKIMMAVTKSTRRPAAALKFARFAAARDRGLRHYEQYGFTTVDGEEWAEIPRLTLFAGSMLRPALDHTVTEFERREGVEVTRVYNGCGILVAQMQAGQKPDAYFACDSEFMEQVSELFPTPIDVSENELVILVQKGNPHGISNLRDLTKEGLRVGIGHEKQCAMGWLTQNTLKEGGIQKEVMANVTVQTPTGDMLVNQLRAKSLDAAVAYLSNAAGSGEFLDAVRIEGIACAIATQPFAIARNSRYHQTMSRLFERIRSADSQESFLAEGFRWQLSDSSAAP